MLTQSFGDSVATNEADNVTAIEFDPTGNYLATGDRGGRIVVFRGVKQDGAKMSARGPPGSSSSAGKLWSPYFQFQSHECEFDYLKSLEIEEKIGRIRFVNSVSNNLLLLSTNDKTVKLWKVYEKSIYTPSAAESVTCGGGLTFPRTLSRTETASQSYQRRAYANAHTYNINSISLNCDGETFSSADDLRINIWNLEYNDRCFTVCDIKPTSMEDLKEVITSAQYSPRDCCLLYYSTSQGAIKTADTRMRSVCDTPVAVLEESPSETSAATTTTAATAAASTNGSSNGNNSNRSFFTEITDSISDFKISRDGRYITTRDYMSVKLWDTHMNRGPTHKFPIQESLKDCMYELYESESVFDKFGLSDSPDSSMCVSGSYSNQFSIIRKATGEQTRLQLPSPLSGSLSARSDASAEPCRIAKEIHIHCPSESKTIRADQKVLHCAWHPHENTIAVAGQAGLYLYKL